MNHKIIKLITSIMTSSAYSHRIQQQRQKNAMFLTFPREYLLNLYNIAESFSPTVPTNVKASYTAKGLIIYSI